MLICYENHIFRVQDPASPPMNLDYNSAIWPVSICIEIKTGSPVRRPVGFNIAVFAAPNFVFDAILHVY